MTDVGFDPLPYVTPDLPGIGGRIKAAPGDFVVDEIPLYEPIGTGEHLYLSIRRIGKTTRELEIALSQIVGVADVDVGCAGLKDKHAVAVQTFSVRTPPVDDVALAARIATELSVEVLWARRHQNKLRRGHLLGNRFTIVLSDVPSSAIGRAREIAAAIESRYLPNFYGPQRFGFDGENVRRARAIFEGRGPRSPWQRRFLLSSWQAALFNHWLAERIRRGDGTRLLDGDIAKKTDTGGLFDVESAAVEQPRLDRKEITYTGPMFGKSMRATKADALALELVALAAFGVSDADFQRTRLEGTRRPAVLFPSAMTIDEHPRGLSLSFQLPKGAYATTLLREITKTDGALPEGDDE